LPAFGRIAKSETINRRNHTEARTFEQIQAIVDSYTGNITSINSLINALSGTLTIASNINERVKAIDSQIQRLDDDKKRRDETYVVQASKINRNSVSMFLLCEIGKRDRTRFKMTDIREELHVLSQQLDTFEHLGDVENTISPIAFFLRGLDRFNSMLYDDALADFLRSRNLAQSQIDNPPSLYGTWDSEERRRNLRVMIEETRYHTGIVFYNVGEYTKALGEFSSAFERNPLDFRCRNYIPEIMFFDNASSPITTEREFEKAEKEMNSLTSEERNRLEPDWNSQFALLKMRAGNFYMRKPPYSLPRSLTWKEL
jgi:tetratricopeptide (TPR) repeat protein